MIQLLGVDEKSKVTVGNINNKAPIDFDEESQKITNEYQKRYADVEKNRLNMLIEQIKKLRLNNKIKEISCSGKACDTPFLKDHNIIWFNTRFTDDGLLGNLSIHQKVGTLTSKVQKTLESKYHPDDVWGDISKHRTASLNRLSKSGTNLTIKLKNYSSEKLIEYKLFDYELFNVVATQEKKLVSEFETSL